MNAYATVPHVRMGNVLIVLAMIVPVQVVIVK